MAKRFNARALKKHHSYTIEDAADAVGAHPQTVRAWTKQGLPVLAGKTPHLLLGEHIHCFLNAGAAKRKTPLGPDQLYCLKCRAAKTPAGNLADFEPTGGDRGRLTGICPDCENMCNRFASVARLKLIAPGLAINLRAAQPSLEEPESAASKTHNPPRADVRKFAR